jgi:hypothetical protein
MVEEISWQGTDPSGGQFPAGPAFLRKISENERSVFPDWQAGAFPFNTSPSGHLPLFYGCAGAVIPAREMVNDTILPGFYSIIYIIPLR